MKKLSNMKIGKRLITGFLIVAFITAGVGILGAVMLNNADSEYTDLYANYGSAQGTVGQVAIKYNQIRVALRDIVLTEDTAKMNELKNEIDGLKNDIDSGLKEFEPSIQTEEVKNAFDNLKQELTTYYSVQDNVINLALQGKNSEALEALNSASGSAANANDIVMSLFEQKEAGGQEKSDVLSKTTAMTEIILWSVVAAAIIIAIMLGIFISRSISKPVNMLVATAESLALGDTSLKLDASSEDEVGMLERSFQKVIDNISGNAHNAELLAAGNIDFEVEIKSDKDILSQSMQKMADTIKSLIQEMNYMSEQHELGDIDIAIPDEKFEGAYKLMAQGLNGMVQGHITVKKKAMACVAEFGRGNFEAPLEKFPGKKAFINETIEQVRSNLKALMADANMLVSAGLEGRLSTRADVSKHYGDFRKIIEGINQTLDAIVEPVKEAAEVLAEVAQKNLKVHVAGDYNGDHAEMKNAINSTIDSLNEIMKDIGRSAEQVALGTKQVSDGSQELSQGSTEQASSVEELSAAIMQVASQTKQNALNAGQANELSTTASNSAVRGNAQVKEMLRSMEDINESSNNISKIIKVIDDIAFQTNILALNAAVEAARAGVHGKGFAVVAEEVRNLAGKSAEAAKETTNMIEGSVRNVEQGTRIAKETALALEEILSNVEKASALVSDIADASNEQAAAIAQINQSIEQVSSVVQSNSATAQQSAAASEELSGQADLLKNLVEQFQLGEEKSRKASAKGIAIKNEPCAAENIPGEFDKY